MQHRNVTPIIDLFRTLVRGRPLQQNSLRFADRLAARTQPPPNLPGGPYAKTTEIYYFTRDARREVQPPIIVTNNQIESGKTSEPLSLTPGKVYQPN